jgi:uncharacterized repeat protein (TIGR01451 family)
MTLESHISVCKQMLLALVLCAAVVLISASPSLAVTYVSAPRALSTAGETYVLSADITASGTAFPVTASNVTLDGQGHTIVYATGGSGNAVALSNRSGITIKNCVITLPDTTTAAGGAHAIYGNSSSNCTVTGNNINLDKGTASGNHGIALLYGSNNVIHDNTVRARPVGRCISVEQNNYAQVYNNVLTLTPNLGGTHTACIYVSCPSISAPGQFNVYGNTITVNGASGSVRDHGIWLAIWAVNGQVHDNQITNNSDESRGIMIDLNSNNNKIYNNTITTNGVNTRAIRLRDSDNNELYNNNIHTTASGATGIEVGRNDASVDSVSYNIIHNNTIQTDSATANALTFMEDSEHNTCYDDRLISNHCCLSVSDSSDNAFTRERFSSGSSPSSYRDVYVAATTGYTWSHPGTGNILTDPSKGSAMVYVWGGGTWDLTVRYTVTVNVTNSQGAAVSGATVSITDAAGATVYTGTTDGNGVAATPLIHFIQSGASTRVTKTPHRITASKSGYTSQQAVVTADHTQTVVIALGGGNVPTITMAAQPTEALPGQVVTYTITYINQTTAQITNCVVRAPVPAHTAYVAGSAGAGVYDAASQTVTWSVGTLAPSQQGQVSYRVTVE